MFPDTGFYYSRGRMGLVDIQFRARVLGWSKAELGLHKGSHFRAVHAPAKCLIHYISKGPSGGND